MVTHIASRHFKLSSKQKAGIDAAVGKIEEQYPRLFRADVMITQERRRFDAEIVVHGNQITLSAHGSGDCPEEAVGAMMERIETQVERRHDRSKEHQTKSVAALEQDRIEEGDGDEGVIDSDSD